MIIATVNWNNYFGRGAEYVRKLFSGIDRHMPVGVSWSSVCFTDDAASVPGDVKAVPLPQDVRGWWNKLAMFREDAFPVDGERILFFDLDTIITGELDGLVDYAGNFAMLRDPFGVVSFGSGIMSWRHGEHTDIWDDWEKEGRPQDLRGDQVWIADHAGKVDAWQDVAPKQCVSFKRVPPWYPQPPPDCRVLYFHGLPKPHICPRPWVKELWDSL